MHRLIKPVFWTFLFLVMMLVIDQFLVQVPPVHPAHAAVSTFYQDFRSRLIDLAFDEKQTKPTSIEAVIEQQKKETVPEKAAEIGKQAENASTAAQKQKTRRYIYSDGRGELHFADSLEDVPDEYRGQAQPMGQ